MPRFNLLKEKIEHLFPDSFNIIGNGGRKSSFEVLINNNLIYSKLNTGLHPDFNELIEKIKLLCELE